MLQHVLVPLDGSPLAEAAVEETRRITSPGTTITLLTIIPQPSFPFYGDEMAVPLTPAYVSTSAEAISEAKRYLERIAEGLRSDGFKVDLIVEYGEDPADIIVDVATESRVDTIVMSTHGRSGMTRWLFGSVTGKVLSTTPCPVLVVPNRTRERVFAEVTSEINYG